MAKVLVIGSGGRCHAIIASLKKSPLVDEIYAAPGNAGISEIAKLVDIKETDVTNLVKFAKETQIDLTVVGPEAALSVGVVDEFKANGLKIFGPTKAAAQIESSKEFAKKLMLKYNIPTAKYEAFDNYDEAASYVKSHGAPIVLKYDGLAAGKGVIVAMNEKEALDGLKEMLVDNTFGKGRVVIEDYLEGPEFSFMCLVNKDKVYPLELAQDHKRAYDNDQGPNTGGMGAYSPLPFITEEERQYALEHIMKKMAKAMVLEGVPFTGVLYGGLMKTKNGIKVIEFNARFGDPETEVVLPRLESDLYKAFIDLLAGKKPNLVWSEHQAIGIVLASKGYPMKYEKNFLIEGLNMPNVFHMGTKLVDGKFYTNGGRVLICVALGSNLKEANKKANEMVKKIKCDNLFYRSDIGHYAFKNRK